MPRLARSTEEVRSKLIEAAVELMCEQGPEQVNTNQVARAAGLGVGTFYAHFRDKQALVQAIVLEALEELAARTEAASAAPARDRETGVRRVIEAGVDFASERPHLFRIAFGREPSSAAGRPTVGPSIRPLERRLLGLQVQGLLDPAIHAATAAKAFTAAQSAVLIWWLEDPSRASREEVVETLVRLHPVVAARLQP